MGRCVGGLAAWVVALGGVLAAGAPAAHPDTPPTPDDIRRTTEEVFRREEFRSGEPQEPSWLLRQLVAFFRWLGSLYAAAPVLFWIILVTCVLLIVLLVVLVIVKVRSAFEGGRERARTRREQAERERLSVAYRQEADARAAAGDYTEAVRFLFRSLVYRFDERGRVSLHLSYTNREYLDLLGDRRPVRDALRVLVDVLDDHWYGQRPCGRPQYDECRAVYDRLAA